MLSQRFTPKLSAPLLLALAVALPGCFNDTADLKLAKAPKATETLNDGQKIRVLDTSTGQKADVTVDEITSAMQDEATGGKCFAFIPTGPSGPGAYACGIFLEHLRTKDLCVARTHLALAKPQAGPVQVGKYSVRSVSSQDRVRFALAAIGRLQQAVATHLDPDIRSMLGIPIPLWRTASPHCYPSDLTSSAYTNIVGSAVDTYVSIYNTVQEAFDIATKEIINVSDSGQVGIASVPGYNSLQDVADFRSDVPVFRMTRQGAARLLAGGINLTSDSPMTRNRCSIPTLKPDAKAALKIFRSAAPSPADVLNDQVTLDSLLNGVPTAPASGNGSVKARLADGYDFALTSNVEQHYALNLQSFRDAREYLKEEIRTFQRSSLALPKPQLPGGRTAVYSPFAGTASEPAPLDPAYYFAIARTPPNILFHQSEYDLNLDPPPFSPAGEFMPLADWIDAAIANAANYLQHSTAIPVAKRNQAMAPLSLLTASGERQGLVQIVRDSGFYIYGFSGSLMVLRGEDNLRCAVTGTSEGGVCPAQIQGWAAAAIPNRAIGVPPYGAAVSMNPIPDDRWYLVRAVNNLSAPGPGDYEVLTGFDLHWATQHSAEHYVANGFDYGELTSPSWKWFNSPVVPAVARKVKEILEPSRRDCERNRITCVFSDLDARLPLEDELTEDADPVESSWKHYLTLARDAATLADSLGADYVASGLQNSQRTEEVELRGEEFRERADASLRELQDTCGTDLDISQLRAWLGTGDTCGSGATCTFDIQAVIQQHPEDPNLRRLGNCLSLSTTDNVPFVSLGTKPLCLWTDGPNNLCGTAPRHCVRPNPSALNGTCAASEVCWGGTATETGVCKPSCVNQEDCPWRMRCVKSLDPSSTVGHCETEAGQCPVLKPDNMSCVDMFDVRDGRPAIPVTASVVPTSTEALGYFDTPTEAIPSGNAFAASDGTSRCDAIAKMRQGNRTKDYRELLWRDYFPDPRNVRAVADALNWEARYGGYAAIYNGPVSVWETGAAFAGAGPQTVAWPCAAVPDAVPGSLFSKSYDCTNETERAKANYAMLHAVLGAHLWAFRSAEELKLAGRTDDLLILRSVPNDGLARGLSGQHPDLSKVSPESLNFWQTSFPISRYDAAPPTEFPLLGPMRVYNASGCSSSACRAWVRPSGTPMVFNQGDYLNFAPFAVFARGTRQKQQVFNKSNALPPQRAWGDALTYLTTGQASPAEFWYGAKEFYIPPQDDSSVWDYLDPLDIGGALGVDTLLNGVSSFLISDSRGAEYDNFIATYGANVGNWLLEGTPSSQSPGMDAEKNPGDRIVITLDDMIDGLELVCRLKESAPRVDLTRPPKISTIGDLPMAAAYVKELARSIRAQVSTQLLANVPRKALDALRAESVTGAYPQYGGKVADSISSIRQGLLSIRDAGLQVGNEIDQIGFDLNNVYDFLKQNANSANIDELRFEATSMEQMTRCGTAIADAASLVTVISPGKLATAELTCINSFAQINFAEGIRDLEQENTQLASEIAINNFSSAFGAHSTNLQSYSLKLTQGLDAIESGLAALETQTKDASRVLTNAVYLGSFHAESEALLTHAIGNLYGQKQTRYERALENAKRLAVLARTAIEQRLGVTLSSMTEDLPLVSAPATWENQVCTFSGVNFESLGSDYTNLGTGSYSEGFIGDYVTKLENVVESYRLAHNFHEGTDTAVVSLKNDVMNVRRSCDVTGPNLLYYASQLEHDGAPGWVRQGCATNGSGELVPNCINARLTGKAPSRYLPNVESYELTFGTGATGGNTGIVQQVDLSPGKYRFSWATPASEGQPSVVAGQVRGQDGVTTALPLVLGSNASEWNRKAVEFAVNEARTVTVGFFNQNGGGASPKITVAAPMLERLPPGDEARALTPFSDTSRVLTIQAPACEDLTGDLFRRSGWRRDCVRLCADGFSTSCSEQQSRSYCYHEAKFDINQRDLQLGRLMNYSGFARGNFNYRIESLALNFVGSGLRDCSNENVSTPCFSAGYVPYSLYHDGPFYVRNAAGDDYKVELFDGKIESARGLALERYLTNPLSETDRSLLQDYVRTELQGRPLDGNFVIRVWDQDGVDFDAIQDVQILLKYRYWTRFN